MRISPALPLLAALLACASAAPAQSSLASTPLVPHTGSSVAYRIGFPRGWDVERKVDTEGEMLSAERGTAHTLIFVADLMRQGGPDLPVSDAEARRIMTSVFMGSDSLMFGLMDEMLNGMRGDGVEPRDVVREMRTLGGQRSGYLSASARTPKGQLRMEAHLTVKDGIMYMLVFMTEKPKFPAHEPLFARVRDSLVFAGGELAAAPE